jgi:hypothetical protein
VDLSDNKGFNADGILAGESSLQLLGISDTCHIVLDHYHLLDQDIGAFFSSILGKCGIPNSMKISMIL